MDLEIEWKKPVPLRKTPKGLYIYNVDLECFLPFQGYTSLPVVGVGRMKPCMWASPREFADEFAIT